MPTITCTKCGKETEVEGKQEGQDFTTYTCKDCQEEINQPAYQAELKELSSKKERTDSEDVRIEFLKAKISGPVESAPESSEEE